MTEITRPNALGTGEVTLAGDAAIPDELRHLFQGLYTLNVISDTMTPAWSYGERVHALPDERPLIGDRVRMEATVPDPGPVLPESMH